MAINPMLSAGVVGIHKGLRGVTEAAQAIAERSQHESPKPSDSAGQAVDAAEPVVSLQTWLHQVQASAKVVKTADAVVGMLLDTSA